jgi:hypothetical protein
MKYKSNKKIFLYLPVPVICICFFSLLQAVDVSRVDLFFYFANLLTLLAGISHSVILNKFLSVNNFKHGLYITLFIMLIAAGICIAVYSYLSLNPEFLTFIFIFSVPFVCWHAYLQLSENNKKDLKSS